MSGAKGVQVSEVDLPESLNPGDRATARIDATNTSNFIGPWDKDRCNKGNNYGIRVEGVLIGPDGEEYVGDTVCAPQHDIVASHEVTSRVSFEAPTHDDTHRYEAFVRTAETGEESGRVSGSIDVFSDSDDAPQEAPDDGDGGTPWPSPGGDGDGDGEGSGNPFDDLFGGDEMVAKIELLALAIAGLGAAYMLGQLFDIQIGGGG